MFLMLMLQHIEENGYLHKCLIAWGGVEIHAQCIKNQDQRLQLKLD